ncbi:MAG: hypothetical protein ACQKBY_03085 [Verrucomicrobiales bacterium]
MKSSLTIPTITPGLALACALSFTSLAGAATVKRTTLIAEGVDGNPFFDAAAELGGTTATSLWDGLSGSDHDPLVYGSFPGMSPWPSAIAPNDTAGVTTTTGLMKTENGASGGFYPASASIYYGGFSSDINVDGGTAQVQVTSPLAGVQSVIFQIQIGEALTYDFFNGVLPSLSINGNDFEAADFSEITSRINNGTVVMPTGPGGTNEDVPVYINTYALQWDLSEVVGPITSLDIEFTGVQHAQLYGLQLDQSANTHSANLLSAYAIPEPQSALLCCGAALLFLRRKRL